jgi:hypothetical protein
LILSVIGTLYGRDLLQSSRGKMRLKRVQKKNKKRTPGAKPPIDFAVFSGTAEAAPFSKIGFSASSEAVMVRGGGLGYDGWNTHKICWAGPVVQTWSHELADLSFLVFQVRAAGAHFFLFEERVNAEVLLGCEFNLSEV